MPDTTKPRLNWRHGDDPTPTRAWFPAMAGAVAATWAVVGAVALAVWL